MEGLAAAVFKREKRVFQSEKWGFEITIADVGDTHGHCQANRENYGRVLHPHAAEHSVNKMDAEGIEQIHSVAYRANESHRPKTQRARLSRGLLETTLAPTSATVAVHAGQSGKRAGFGTVSAQAVRCGSHFAGLRGPPLSRSRSQRRSRRPRL